MNVEKLLELAETANTNIFGDAELVWLFNKLTSAISHGSAKMDDMMIFHRLYGKKVVAIICDWQEQGHRHEEMIESVEEPMRARLEA